MIDIHKYQIEHGLRHVNKYRKQRNFLANGADRIVRPETLLTK